MTPSVSLTRADRRALRPPGAGLLVAVMLLLILELSLHGDALLHRYRSVFAAGRALDKVIYVERHRPELLILGNSRADNGFDPTTVRATMGSGEVRSAFNLGIPGADTRVLLGVVRRLDAEGAFGSAGINRAALVLDEALVQAVDSLGQEVFFADIAQMWRDGQYLDAFRAAFRLYGYSANLRQLREPGTLARFVQASVADIDPVGGAAAAHLGYRAGFGGLQDRASAMLQEAGSRAPPDPVNVANLFRILDLLAARGVSVAIVYPPLLNRDVLYLAGPARERAPYLAIVAEFERRHIPQVVLDAGPPRNPAEFVNPGHLDDQGAQRYSALLGRALAQRWGAAPRHEAASPMQTPAS